MDLLLTRSSLQSTPSTRPTVESCLVLFAVRCAHAAAGGYVRNIRGAWLASRAKTLDDAPAMRAVPGLGSPDNRCRCGAWLASNVACVPSDTLACRSIADLEPAHVAPEALRTPYTGYRTWPFPG